MDINKINKIVRSIFDDIINNRSHTKLFNDKERSLLSTCKLRTINRTSGQNSEYVYIEITTNQKYTFEIIKKTNTIARFITILISEFKNKVIFQYKLKFNPFLDAKKLIYFDQTSINLANTFDNFIVDESNKQAYQISKEIAETNFRDTYLSGTIGIFGDRGLGKTHLQESIINHLLESENNFHIYYFKKNLWQNYFKKVASDKNYEEAIENLSNADLVIFDDLSLFFNTNVMFFLVALYDLIDLRIAKKKITLYSIHQNPERLQFKFSKDKTALKDFHNVFNYELLNNNEIKATIKKEFESRLCNRIINIDYPSTQAKVRFIKMELAETGFIDIANINKKSEELLELIADVMPNDFRRIQGKVYDLANEILDLGLEQALNNFYRNMTGVTLYTNDNSEIIILKNKISQICKQLNIPKNSIFEKNKKNPVISFIKKTIIYFAIIDGKIPQTSIASTFNVTKGYISKIKKEFMEECKTKYLQKNNEFEKIYKEITKILRK